MTLTDDQRQIIMEIDSISKMKTVETWEERWREYIVANKGENRKTLSSFALPPERDKKILAILGPGASILQYDDCLDELREVATLCILPTALEWCESIGIAPDFVVIQDSGHDEPDFFQPGAYPVLGPTTLNPRVVEQQDPHLFTLLLGNGSTEAPVFGPWNKWSLQQDRDLDGGIVSMGCVTNMALSVIELFRQSKQLRAEKVVLFGQDFAGWKGFARVPRLEETECPTIEEFAVHNWIEWQGYHTDARMIWYRFKLLNLWRHTFMPLYSCSEGMLEELPYVGFDNIMRGKWPRYPSRAKIVEMFTEFSALMADTFPREETDVK